LWLAGWRETNNGGFKVTFDVSPDDTDFFRGEKAANGKIAGQRYGCVIVRLNDDETPVPEKPKANDTKYATSIPKTPTGLAAVAETIKGDDDNTKHGGHHFPGGLCGLAIRWCDDKHFQNWLAENHRELPPVDKDRTPEEFAKDGVLFLCGIASRKELDAIKEAGQLFRSLILKPYTKKRKEDGVDQAKA
jgi:hypothetical protein